MFSDEEMPKKPANKGKKGKNRNKLDEHEDQDDVQGERTGNLFYLSISMEHKVLSDKITIKGLGPFDTFHAINWSNINIFE